MDRYILGPTHRVRREPDLIKWAKWIEEGNRRVAHDVIHGATISTVFLGIDHGYNMLKKPILFETMIFGGPHNDHQTRCATWTEAIQMHKNAVALVKGGKNAAF